MGQGRGIWQIWTCVKKSAMCLKKVSHISSAVAVVVALQVCLSVVFLLNSVELSKELSRVLYARKGCNL